MNEPSSGGEGPVDKADMQHADTVSISECQTSVSPEEAPSRGETVDLSAPSPVDEGPVINADTKSVESVGDSGRLKLGTSEYYRSVQ